MSENQTENQKQKRGFAAMTPQQQRAIASAGGKAAHEKGVAHKWTRAEAITAGKKGGQASRPKNRPPAPDNQQ